MSAQLPRSFSPTVGGTAEDAAPSTSLVNVGDIENEVVSRTLPGTINVVIQRLKYPGNTKLKLDFVIYFRFVLFSLFVDGK